MSRVKLVELSDMTEAQKIQYNRFPSNLVRGLLLTKESASGYLSLGASFRISYLTDRERELVILKVAMLSHSAYEKMQHLPIAKSVGITEMEIAAIEKVDLNPFSPKEQLLLQFVEDCVKYVKVNDTLFKNATEVYSPNALAELTLLIGHYMMTARFLETLEIDLDEHATDWNKLKV